MQNPPQNVTIQPYALPAPTSGPLLGVGGLPYAAPYFGGAEDEIRRGFHCCCFCDHNPGPNIPVHWYDGGRGWVSRYFTDVVPFDSNLKQNGRFRCQIPVGPGGHCNHEIPGESCCCDGGICWCPTAVGTANMAAHLMAVHGVRPPPLQEWKSGLCDTEGCFDTLFCVPCQGARQMMALSGYADKFHWWWCIAFTLLGCRSEGDRRNYWVPPHIYVAAFTRPRMITLNNIDEGLCTMCLKIWCCPICSVAQTYRELKYSGVWTGSTCCNDPPQMQQVMPAIKMS